MSALGVGRSTIREAVNGLAMLGVLEIRHGQGALIVDAEAAIDEPIDIAEIGSLELIRHRMMSDLEPRFRQAGIEPRYTVASERIGAIHALVTGNARRRVTGLAHWLQAASPTSRA